MSAALYRAIYNAIGQPSALTKLHKFELVTREDRRANGICSSATGSFAKPSRMRSAWTGLTRGSSIWGATVAKCPSSNSTKVKDAP